MKSYIKFNRHFFSELERASNVKKRGTDAAKFHLGRAELAISHIHGFCAEKWTNKTLLEVGCGQKLAYTLPFSQENKVIAIDTEPPFHRPYLKSFISLLRHSGYYRTLKTTANEIIGTRRAYRTALSEATAFTGRYNFSLHRMNANSLDFPDNYFDGAFSFSVFEHISSPEIALAEVKRVLKPNSIFYLDLNLFTGVHGDHDPRSYSDSRDMLAPPWKHLRKSCEELRVNACYLNKVRLPHWKKLLESTFSTIHYVNIEGEADRNRLYLTSEIRQELSDYTEEELLTTTFVAIVRKGIDD